MIQFPDHIDQISRLAQVSELRHRVISHNLANANTPNYQRLDVSFDQQFSNVKRRNGEFVSAETVIAEDRDAVAKMDGNTVDVDQELGHLNQNSMLFQMYTQILSTHLSTMRRAMGQS